MISIRDEDKARIERVEQSLKECLYSTNRIAIHNAIAVSRNELGIVLAGIDSLMREQPSTPRTVMFNDLPPKGWTGPS